MAHQALNTRLSEKGALHGDKEYSTFCSISLNESTGAKGNVEVVQKALQSKKTQKNTIKFSFHVSMCILLFLAGSIGVCVAIFDQFNADQYLFLGALVSFCFSLIVILTYSTIPMLQGHPNPLIFSKSLVDILLALLYIFEYCVTEFKTEAVSLPFRIAAITQALLVCGEFWFFAMPIDLLQSITNPFTSYSHNIRVYWFYSTLSGAVCGIALWYLDGATGCGNSSDCAEVEKKENRYFWFHYNTEINGFFWHRWISYHVWVLVYLFFGAFCILYVRRRLKRGLEETFDVRKRVLSHAFIACCVYISWSSLIMVMFAITNSPGLKSLLGQKALENLISLSAFLHSARGCLNILVWLVINGPDVYEYLLARGRATSITIGSPIDGCGAKVEEEVDMLLKPELNTALRKQTIQMATTGIIESVEHYHRLHRGIKSNQTFHLDWQSPKREIRQLKSQSASSLRSISASTLGRTSTIQVVEEQDHHYHHHHTRFPFLPMSLKEMQFYDFQPRVFASIRRLYGIDDSDYILAFRHTMNERISEGKSGAFVFNTVDRKYLVKSMTSTEKNVLLELLPSYLRYIKWNPMTLLPRFFGVHAMNMYGQIFYFVVMGNILNTSEVIHRRYDIKGSWVDRNAPACVLGEKYRCSKCNRFFEFGSQDACDSTGEEHYPDTILRDNDLKKRLKLHPNVADQLMKQIVRDSNFLCSMGIMDYSLLIGIHYAQFTISHTNEVEQIHSTNSSVEILDKKSKRRTRNSQMSSSNSGTSTTDEDDLVSLYDDPAANSVENKIEMLPTEEEVEDVLIAGSEKAIDIRCHKYRAHKVSGPSTYYFGIIDILQKWSIKKQVERVYKIQLLRKDGRGLSAIHPTIYAARFQQKMAQLFSQRVVEIEIPASGSAVDQ